MSTVTHPAGAFPPILPLAPRTSLPRRDLSHASQAAGLAAALERASHIPWHQLHGLYLLAGCAVRALAAGPLAEQQCRSERLGQRALLQLLRRPVVLLGPGAAPWHDSVV